MLSSFRWLFRRRAVIVVLGIVLVGSGASLISPRGQRQPEISLGGDTLPVARSGETWIVTTRPAERVKVFSKNLPAAFEEASQNLRQIHTLSGKIVIFFLKNRSDQELEAELSALANRNEVSIESLGRQVDIQLLGNGWDKSVYTVTFQGKASEAAPVRFALKISKRGKKTIQREIFYLRKLNKEEKGTVPELGKMFNAGIRSAFFEEFVSGPSVGFLIRKGEFSPEIHRATLGTILKIYRALGKIPYDILPHNFIVDDLGGERERVVMIDLGSSYLEKPGEILEALHIQYGGKHFKENELIFQTLLEILGKAEGRDFLKKAFEELQHETQDFHLSKRHSVYFHLEKWKMGRLEQMGIELKRKGELLELTRNLESYLSDIRPPR